MRVARQCAGTGAASSLAEPATTEDARPGAAIFVDDSISPAQVHNMHEGRQAFLHATDLTLMAEDSVLKEEPVFVILHDTDPMLRAEEP